MAVVAFFVIFPCLVYADCASDFKAVEKGFKVTYKYNEDTDDYTVTFINPDFNRYSFAQTSAEEIKKSKRRISGNTLTTIVEHYKGTKYYYTIQALYGQCNGVAVKEETIEFKKYNPYADSPLCVGNEDFVLCQKEYDKEIDEETFKSRLDTYIKTKNETKNESSSSDDKDSNKSSIEKTTKNIVEKTTNFFEENLTIIIIVAVVIVALIIGGVFLIRKSIESRRLE